MSSPRLSVRRLVKPTTWSPTLLWVAGVASCVVVALGTLPHTAWASVDARAPASIAVQAHSDEGGAKSRARTRCEFCGVVEAIRRMDPVGAEPALYEFTVRLRSGAARVSTVGTEAASAWLVGDAIMLIGGASPPTSTAAARQLTGTSAIAR